MPNCNICGERFWYESTLEPGEPCMCGEKANFNLWYDCSWEHWAQFTLLRWRWSLAKAMWKVSEWVTPK